MRVCWSLKGKNRQSTEKSCPAIIVSAWRQPSSPSGHSLVIGSVHILNWIMTGQDGRLTDLIGLRYLVPPSSVAMRREQNPFSQSTAPRYLLVSEMHSTMAGDRRRRRRERHFLGSASQLEMVNLLHSDVNSLKSLWKSEINSTNSPITATTITGNEGGTGRYPFPNPQTHSRSGT